MTTAASSPLNFSHYTEPWTLTTGNGREIAVGIGEITDNAVAAEVAYLGINNRLDTASSLLTADELTALIDQLTIIRNAMGPAA